VLAHRQSVGIGIFKGAFERPLRRWREDLGAHGVRTWKWINKKCVKYEEEEKWR
jgi:hypothetical protein